MVNHTPPPLNHDDGAFEYETDVMTSATICTVVGDDGNRHLLHEYLENHETYDVVDFETWTGEIDVDLFVVDREGFLTHGDKLRAHKVEESPVIVPVLLLVPENRTERVDMSPGGNGEDYGEIFDDIVNMPIRSNSLEWRLKSLLRLRAQSLTINGDLLQFKQGVEAAGTGIYITQRDGTIEYVNPAFEAITGYTKEEAVGKNPRILKSGEMSEAYYEDLWETLLSGETWNEEIANRRKDGELFTVQQTISPVEINGEIRSFVAVMTDISERIQREEKLKRRTRAIDEAPVGIVITDPNEEDNPLIYMNDAVEEITGYERDELMGENLRMLQGENTDQNRVQQFRDAVESENPTTVELRNYRKDGSEFWNRMGIAPVRDEAGDVEYWVGFQQDVTQRKRRHAQIGVMNRVLRHNIRNEMNVIRGRAEIIEAKGTEAVASSAETIIETSNGLMEIAEKAKEITSILRDPPKHREIDVGNCLRQIAARLGEEYPSASISVRCPDELVASLTEEFETAISELVTNAIVHNDSTSPEVVVSASDDNGQVSTTIADNGPGIPEEEQNIHLDEGQNPLSHGSGLGLWMANVIVSLAGGSMTFEENTPRGSKVHVKLPRE